MKKIENPNTRKNIEETTGKAYDKAAKKRRQSFSRLDKMVMTLRKQGVSRFEIRDRVLAILGFQKEV